VTACGCGRTVPVVSERCVALRNVTVRVSGESWVVLVVKPGAGTAETRQIASAPMLKVTRPPTDCMLCTPTPPRQVLDEVRPPVVAAVVGGRVVGGRVDGVAVGVLRGVAAGEVRGADVAGTSGLGGEDGALKSVGSARAVGGSGDVECTTKRTARKAAVTVRAVQHSQIMR
jgi:hypothetical protein